MTIHLSSQSDLEDAVHALVKQDVRLKPIFELTGMPALRQREPGFAGLAAIVTGQQLSTASAAAIWGRLTAAFDPFDPEPIRKARQTSLSCPGTRRDRSSGRPGRPRPSPWPSGSTKRAPSPGGSGPSTWPRRLRGRRRAGTLTWGRPTTSTGSPPWKRSWPRRASSSPTNSPAARPSGNGWCARPRRASRSSSGAGNALAPLAAECPPVAPPVAAFSP